MADILHNFHIHASPAEVFNSITTPEGLNAWWTEESDGQPIVGTTYRLNFGEPYRWQAVVTKSKPDELFELRMTKADDEWIKTKVGFRLAEKDKQVDVSFYHKGWRNKTEHFKISNFCWAMYLRILKRNIEFGEIIPYSKRLSV
jgi:uncharacterized protein YndB with AHSA1/START domain